jgi:hypothetical protein
MGKKQSSRTGIRDAFRAVHILSQMAGLAPYNFATNPCNKSETIDISWKKNFTSFMWSLAMLSIQAVGFVYILSSNFTQNPNSVLELVFKTLQFPLINATGLAALILSMSINRKKMLMIIEKLSITDKCIFQKDHTVYEKHKRVFTIVLIISVLYHITLHTINTYFYPSSHINYYYSVSICLCDLVWAANDSSYVNAVEILAQNLMAMNKQLDAILVTQTHSSYSSDRHTRPEVFRSFRVADELHTQYVRGPINFDRNNVFRRSVSDVTSGRISARVLELRICYNNLYHISHLINSVHGFTLLMGFTAYTVCTIADVYGMCCILVTPYREHEPISTPKITISILWTIASVLKTFCIVFASERAKSEHKKTVHKIQKLILYVGENGDVREQLESFSNQLANNRIEFTACGVFGVNFKLVRSFVCTVVTYVIVLVQITWFRY